MIKLIESPKEIANEHYLLKLSGFTKKSEAGQFINIKVGTGTDPLLRRPFSIFNHENDIMEIVIRVIGRGTFTLSQMEPGDMDIIGPLGNTFTIPKDKKVLLVGGGVGNAPLHNLAKSLKQQGNTVDFIYGARSKEFIYIPERFESTCDNFFITTDDGSAGEKGFVTDKMKSLCESNNYDIIYTCGPTVMMKNVARQSPKDTLVEISVENYFGCGVGLCVGCTIETVDGFRRACVDGPVFDSKKILWDNIAFH